MHLSKPCITTLIMIIAKKVHRKTLAGKRVKNKRLHRENAKRCLNELCVSDAQYVVALRYSLPIDKYRML